jgi:hypothetical protein
VPAHLEVNQPFHPHAAAMQEPPLVITSRSDRWD